MVKYIPFTLEIMLLSRLVRFSSVEYRNLKIQGKYGSFTTEKKLCYDFVQNFNPEKIISKVENVMETPTNYTATFFNLDGTKRGEYKWTKVK